MPELLDSRGRVIAAKITVARTLLGRTIGLIGKRSLNTGEGIWIERCPSIHTYLMSFPIDVIFVDSANRIVLTRERVMPWTLYVGCRGADACIELAVGTLSRCEVADGDVVSLRDE